MIHILQYIYPALSIYNPKPSNDGLVLAVCCNVLEGAVEQLTCLYWQGKLEWERDLCRAQQKREHSLACYLRQYSCSRSALFPPAVNISLIYELSGIRGIRYAKYL